MPLVPVCVLAALCLLGAPSEPGFLVGVNYFAGWWEPLPNKWHGKDGQDWRPSFPDRIPLLGEYNGQEVMDREIAAAADHGVDFFAILWYYNPPDTEREPNARFLERGLKDFMASPNAPRMRFMIEFCNHPPYLVSTGEEWRECVAFWVTCMKHPSYLRVGGKAVFKVHGGHFFLKQNGENPTRCKERLDYLRAEARAAGVGELLIGCGIGASEEIPPGHWAAQLFDFTGVYMDLPGLPPAEKDYPYPLLADFAAEGRARHASDAVPHLPYVPAGWNPRPWGDPRPCFAFPTRQEWVSTLERVKHDLAEMPSLGLPGQKAFTIYAWNEYGEGGITAPTRGDGHMKLEAIRDVFGR